MNDTITSELGKLIDTEESDFIKHCDDKNVGYLMSLKNLFLVTYGQVSNIKRDIMTAIESGDISNDKNSTTVLNGCFAKMIKLEHRIFLLQTLIDEKTLS